LDTIIVTGINFFNSPSLVCVLDSISSRAVFITSSQVKCTIKIKKTKPVYYLQVSNDDARTASNSLALTVQTDMPRITRVVHPNIFFADGQPIKITLQGKNFMPYAQPGLLDAIGISLKA
jgi:hypothetical protein